MCADFGTVKPLHIDLEALIEQRFTAPKWVTMRELSSGPGFNRGRIDVAAIAAWQSGHGRTVACEVKRSRGDFVREIQNPAKRRWVEQSFRECYFVTPSGLVRVDEIPEGWGLLEATRDGTSLRQKKAPMQRDNALGQGVATMVVRKCADLMAAMPDESSAGHGQGRCVPVSAFEMWNKIADDAVSESKRLRCQMDRLYEPLAQLAFSAAAHGIDYCGDRETVEEMIRAAVSNRIDGMTRQIQRARDDLDSMLTSFTA